VGFPIQKSQRDTCFRGTLAFADCKRSEQRRKNRLLYTVAYKIGFAPFRIKKILSTESSLLLAPKLIARDHFIEMLGPDRLTIALLKNCRSSTNCDDDWPDWFLPLTRMCFFLIGLDGQRYCTFSERMRAVSDLHVQEVELRASASHSALRHAS
jgi:hypothetical protein